MPRPTRITHLPLEISSVGLKPLTLKGEPVVVACINNVGNLNRYRQSGRTNKTFIFEHTQKDGCHVLRVPHSIWHMDDGALAKELLDQGNRQHNIVVLVELCEEQQKAIAKATPVEKPAGPPPLRLPRHLRHLPQYEGKEVTKDSKGRLCVDGKPATDNPVEGLPQDQSEVVEEVLAPKASEPATSGPPAAPAAKKKATPAKKAPAKKKGKK